MIGVNDISIVKKEIDNHIGTRVKIRAHKGRKKIVTRKGVIQSTYPSLFVISLDDETESGKNRTVSYTYTDVLTKSVELTVCHD